jgi:hypothetical protein
MEKSLYLYKCSGCSKKCMLLCSEKESVYVTDCPISGKAKWTKTKKKVVSMYENTIFLEDVE